MRNDDLEQMEYIRKWKEQKEIKAIMKEYRKDIRRLHLSFAKDYFKLAIKELILCFKWKGGAE